MNTLLYRTRKALPNIRTCLYSTWNFWKHVSYGFIQIDYYVTLLLSEKRHFYSTLDFAKKYEMPINSLVQKYSHYIIFNWNQNIHCNKENNSLLKLTTPKLVPPAQPSVAEAWKPLYNKSPRGYALTWGHAVPNLICCKLGITILGPP